MQHKRPFFLSPYFALLSLHNKLSGKCNLLHVILTASLSLSVYSTNSFSQQATEAEPSQEQQTTLNEVVKDELLTLPIESLGKKQPVSVEALDGMQLGADYFQGAQHQGGVLLLHGCHSKKSDYQQLGKILAQQGLHALALDFRGFDTSANEQFSHHKIKSQSSDMVSYQANVAILTAFWDGDIKAAYQFLKNKIHKERGISVIATGCAAEQAIALAEEARLDSIVFIVPNIGLVAKEQYKNLIDYPTYFIAPAYQNASFSTTKELFEWNGHDLSKWQIFKGNLLGHTLLRKSPELAQDIAQWINRVQ